MTESKAGFPPPIVTRPTSRRSILAGAGVALAWPALAGVLPGHPIATHTVAAGPARHAASPGPQPSPGASVAFARRLAGYICAVRFEDLPPAVVAQAKEHLIYHVGLAFAGAHSDAGRQAAAIAQQLGAGRGQSTIIGHSLHSPPLEAAFANASSIRATGLDDVLFPSATHAGLLTYPAALAVGEQLRCSGKEFLTAIVTGYEVLGKMVTEQDEGRAARRPSMPFGPFAAVAATARLMRLTPEQTANAIGYAADGSMGLKEGNEQQPTHIYGLINRTAITAAILAQAGGETAPTILEGKYGFYATLVGAVPDVDGVIGRLGTDPEILRATQKRYPGTAMNIVPIQFVLELTKQYSLTAETVAHVEIELPDDRRTFEDSTSSGPFPTHTQAAASVPFQTAIILLDGKIDLARYDQLDNPAILAVIRKVAIRLAPHEDTRYARVRITMVDGRVLEREGSTYVFQPIDAVEWLVRNGGKVLPRVNIERFAALVRDLEQVPDLRLLMAPLAPKQ